jgi:hypothetical protein
MLTNLHSKTFSTTRKRGQMNRIRGIVLGLTVLAASAVLGNAAWAQDTTGRVTGRVTDKDTGAAMAGVTVIVQGPQGEDATVTDGTGFYQFSSLGVGTYTIRYYVANTSTQVEQPDVKVSADKTVRVNAQIASSAAAAAQQTYVITGRPPSVNVGSARIGYTFDQDFTLSLPVNPNYGAVIQRAPGAFVDASGNVSIGGATGLENVYIVNGMNVTGLRYGNLESGGSSIGGGTNLPNEFLTQIDVNSGGYSAEFGGAMGGVINTVLKSGSNEFHGSVFAAAAPYWLSATPSTVTTLGSAVAGVRKPDFDDRIGFEVGGPIIKDKLFFWAGFAPTLQASHVFRYTYALQSDGMGGFDKDKLGTLLPNDTQRLNENRRVYSYAATINYQPKPEHKLELSLFGTPSFNNQLRSFNNGEELFAAFPGPDGNGPATWAQERVTKTNTDVSAHWTSKLFDRKWQIEGIAGMHNEYFNQRSPSDLLNRTNQLNYWFNDLGTLENLPGCEGGACPVNPFYSAGGFGQLVKYNAFRWSGEIKSTHLFEAGGRHELKYGDHLDFETFNLNRNYSGGQGAHGLVSFFPDGMGGQVLQTQNLYRLPPGVFPSDFSTDGSTRFPFSDLVNPAAGNYVDNLHAYVKGLLNSLYLQDSYSPAPLRNLSINVGARYEMQKLYDMNGAGFLDVRNLAPRIGAVYDPFGDGRSKISASYGQFYEAIPLDIAARYFGGENFIQRGSIPLSSCANPDPYTWTGANEWASCKLPAPGSFMGDTTTGYFPTNNQAYAQPHIQGQYHNEVVATLEREVMEDMTARIDYTHRWIGRVIEDGYGDTTLTDVLANPGDVPQSAITQWTNDYNNAQSAADNLKMMSASDPNNNDLKLQAATAQSKADALKTHLNGLNALAGAPKPERTYDAITLSVNKRFSKAWFLRASYTYSRLVGNYEGLYQTENNYVAPNGTNAYDTADLYLNNRGYLPNDHPHQGKLDGFYSHPVGPGKITLGLSFFARSGMPRNYMSNLVPNTTNQIVFLLPRGSAGRTPAVTQFDGHIAYSQKLQEKMTLEAYVDLFNIFDQQAALQTDDNWTFDAVAPIVGGTSKDLAYAKSAVGGPATPNKNFGRPIVYQAPFYSRLGLRLMF